LSCAQGRDAELTYEAFAPAYDEFTAHYDHELWLGNFLPKLEAHGLRRGGLLDVGCGTGKGFLPMIERGWEVTACDISPSMLALAKEKAGDSARLSVADMRDLPLYGQFDLVVALDDAVNYLLDSAELESALGGLARNLGPGGLLMFDLNTLRSYRTFFAETMVVERGGWRMTWRGQAAADTPPGSICESRLQIERTDLSPNDATLGNASPHVHRQRHFPAEEVLTLLAASGLECLDVFGHGADAIPQQPLDERIHQKAVFVARLQAG